MNIDIYADGASEEKIIKYNNLDHVKGFTTNPTLLKSSGVSDYKSFAKSVLSVVKNKPISFEVISDNHDEMYKQALEISSWGKNVYVKIPIINTQEKSSLTIIKKLIDKKIQVNITAVMTQKQIVDSLNTLGNSSGNIISIFAGRIADTGIDPIPFMKFGVDSLKKISPNSKILWASPREVLNVYQADQIGCHIITLADNELKKLDLKGKDLDEFSKETVTMFYNDALSSEFKI